MAARRQRALAVERALASAYPESTTALDFASPFQLLVATLLSAQSTDVAVNAATRRLFAKYPDAPHLAAASVADVESTIGSLGLWRNKARNVVALSAAIVQDHAGRVPRDLEALVALPGVGRKTACAVLGVAFGIPAGLTVDTHMLRINRLVGLSRATDPAKMATDLERLLPPSTWTSYTHRVIDHGRTVCVARRPRCGVCPLAPLCDSAFAASAGYREANDMRTPASAANASWRSRSRGGAGRSATVRGT